MENIVFVDTETTGLDPDHHEIWEVGLIYLKDSGGWAERSWQLPVDLGRADAFALSIGQFHERRLLSSQQTALDSFSTTFAKLTRGKHLAGAVVSFDDERLRKLLQSNGACPEWHYHLIDVEVLAAGYVHGRGGMVAGKPGEWLPSLPYSSEELSAAIGVDPFSFDRHTALGDARWAKAIYEAVAG